MKHTMRLGSMVDYALYYQDKATGTVVGWTAKSQQLLELLAKWPFAGGRGPELEAQIARLGGTVRRTRTTTDS